MNCREAETLIPLFVEADLEAAEMQQVTKHVETCAACRVTVAEFAASQSALQAVATPAFDDALLAEMRSAVMTRVDQSTMRPAFVEWLQPIWNWKFAFAMAAVMLLVVGVAMSRREAKPVAPQVAGDAKKANSDLAVVREKSDVKSPAIVQQPQPRMGRKQKMSGGERNSESDLQQQSRPERAANDNNQIAAVAPSGAGGNTASLPEVGTPGFTLSPAPQAETAKPNNEKSVSEPEMLRMEFQTADPNIRIIWLTPKSALASK